MNALRSLFDECNLALITYSASSRTSKRSVVYLVTVGKS